MNIDDAYEAAFDGRPVRPGRDPHGEAFPWAVCDNDGVADRFATEAEAREALLEGGYPDECIVAWVGPLT